ncbi:hypothetical protein WKW50_25820 [Ochrobactrum sp. GPK 3]|uniref:hypothetical protein n=1 Tax=Brucella sp. 22210 TaxID=3453892 RepID=UPI0031384BC6
MPFGRCCSKSSSQRDEVDIKPTLRNLLDRASDPRNTSVAAVNLSWSELTAAAAPQAAPRNLYRSHVGTPNTIQRSGVVRKGPCTTGDEYYRDIISHTARTGGSSGAILSLASETTVANRFATGATSLVTIRTDQDPFNYQPIAKIIHDHGDRLIQEKKIQPATVLGALRNIDLYGENEYFYVGGLGNIPPNHIENVTKSYPGGPFGTDNDGWFQDVQVNRR